MAGIGFVLRKLTRQDNLIGILGAYLHSAMAAVGPWLFTVITLAVLLILNVGYVGPLVMNEFRAIIIYNFSISLVLSAPVYMVATRYLADCIHHKDVSHAASVFLGGLSLIYITQLPLAAWFYFVYLGHLSPVLKLSAFVNFMLITSVWLIGVYLTALKDYLAVSANFFLGMLLAIVLAFLLAGSYGLVGLVNGFSIGLAFATFAMIARIFSEYPYPIERPFEFLRYFKKHWELPLGGFLYNAGVWADKWIMWFAPEHTIYLGRLHLYDIYDTATFLAMLTVVPAMAVFMFSVETNFFEHYLRFFQDILKHAPWRRIRRNHLAIIASVLRSARNFIILQGSICFLAIMLAPRIFTMLGFNFLELGIFRITSLGAFFHVLMLFLTILLSYLDCKRMTVKVFAIFFLTNIVFTIMTIGLGFAWYGFGYFVASLVAFVVASFMAFTYMRDLPYHAFITNNPSVRKDVAVDVA